jgi:Signal transduction histidine kinase
MAPKKKVVRVSLQQTADSVIVHDMKNLAFRLSALLQNMEENYDSPMFKQSMADILNDTIQKMHTIVNRYRETQQQVVVKLKVDINQILMKAIEDLPARKTREVQMEFWLIELPLVWGDPFYLHNAFHSIIENATDAMPRGGRLTIGTKILKQRNKKQICVEISDTGVGMTEAFVKSELFSPFHTTKDTGLGLGLFTSRQIIAMHSGKIEVDSVPGSGTTFRVLLPVDENGKNSHH